MEVELVRVQRARSCFLLRRDANLIKTCLIKCSTLVLNWLNGLKRRWEITFFNLVTITRNSTGIDSQVHEDISFLAVSLADLYLMPLFLTFIPGIIHWWFISLFSFLSLFWNPFVFSRKTVCIGYTSMSVGMLMSVCGLDGTSLSVLTEISQQLLNALPWCRLSNHNPRQGVYVLALGALVGWSVSRITKELRISKKLWSRPRIDLNKFCCGHGQRDGSRKFSRFL